VVASCETQRAGRANLRHRPDEHAARAGDRVLHLAARRHDVEDGGLDRCAIGAAARQLVDAAQLAIRGGVKIQDLDIDADLVRPDLRRGIQALGGLGQRDLVTRRLEDPVQTHGRALSPGDRSAQCSVDRDSHCFLLLSDPSKRILRCSDALGASSPVSCQLWSQRSNSPTPICATSW
jgi:hypothetical protein